LSPAGAESLLRQQKTLFTITPMIHKKKYIARLDKFNRILNIFLCYFAAYAIELSCCVD
jgi:hypothetical protein